MALSIADQIALDDALVAPADRLKIGKCNLRLSSDVTSKEATLQVVYDVLKLTPFYKAFQVTADAPQIYMQEFWASAYVHNRSVRFKMNNKKHIIGLEQFRDILQICPRIGNKKFVDPPLEKEILIFLASLGHSGDIRKLTDVNVNKLHQPWRSFAAVINKYLSGTPSYDSLRLSQAQILWGMYNKKNVDYAYLLWEDFIFKIENKSTKKGSAMYYPRFTKLVVNYVMEKDLDSERKQVALTNEEIRNLEFLQRVYAMASGQFHPKTKGNEGTGIIPGVPDAPDYDSEDDIFWKSSDDDQDDEQAQDDEDAGKIDVNESSQDDEDDDDHDNDEKVHDDDEHDVDETAQEDDDEELTETDDDDDKDSDNKDEGTNVEGVKSDEEATYEEDQGTEAVKDTQYEAVDIAVQLKKSSKNKSKRKSPKFNSKSRVVVSDQLEYEVLVRSSKEANSSHAVAANLSELELKKILIDKMEANKSINMSEIQRQLHKALVEAYEADKILLDTYGDTVTIKRPRDDADDDQEPSAGTDWGSKRRRSGKEPSSTSAPSETTTKTAGKTTSKGSQTHKKSASQSALVEEAMQPTDAGTAEQEFDTGVHDEQAEEEPLPLVPNSQGRRVIPFQHFINNDLEYLLGGASSRKYSTSVTKTKAADYGHIKWIEDLVPNSMESARDVYSKRRIIAVTQVEMVEWHNYKHLDWITVRRDDDVLYKFKEGDFHRLRLQDIEDMLLLLVQGKLTNLNVEERIAFNVALRMFTRSIVIQRRVEDLQLGVESYQKKLNLTKPDTYRSDLRRRDAYTSYSDPRGFIYANKDKKNRLMRIDELHKFSDGTLDDVRTVLNDRLKGIRMEYLPKTYWSQRDKANARAMIQAIDKRLKTRRIMRSLERFVGGRPYGGDLRLLQRTI
ncbi:hypothetical protein Tco_0991354 [Tanacetum coccineum]|uniref:Uncharacterized protein n=1 Tax=Tanacetum coccineum TaxID=301880 RepID=A0ABQ5EZB0_9ASTR